jgi:hypothetical protein
LCVIEHKLVDLLQKFVNVRITSPLGDSWTAPTLKKGTWTDHVNKGNRGGSHGKQSTWMRPR